jgi:hypothetical protein
LIEVTGVPPGNRYARPSYFGIADFKVQQKAAEDGRRKTWEISGTLDSLDFLILGQ